MDERKKYIEGDKLVLTYSESKDNSFERTFIIDKYLGSGGSGVVYLVKYMEENNHGIKAKHSGILKELNPRYAEFGSEEYYECKKRFLESYKLQTEFHSECNEAKNITCNTEGIYEGYNKIYILMSADDGESYNNTNNESLEDILKISLSIAKALKVYHDNGYLHLDLKPDNILILDQTKELVKLFDFDSICKKDEILKSNLLSTKNWRAPETYLRGKRKDICEATDLYSIGCIVFKKVFGRFPTPDDRTQFARYDFSNTLVDFENIKSTIFDELRRFFNKTIQSTVSNRYQSADEVIESLENLISIAEYKIPKLGTISWSVSQNKIGREKELLEIHERLQRDNVVFIHGMGGIGKSELAKMYSEKYREDYIARQFVSYYSEDDSKNLQDVISELVFEGQDLDKDDYYEKYRKFQMLDNRNLIVIDNFNTSDDEYIENVITNDSNGPRVIFTTRNEYEDYSEKFLKLDTLNEEDCIDLFYKFYKKGADNRSKYDEVINEILMEVQYNTLLIKLIALNLEKSDNDPRDILRVLKDTDIKSLDDAIRHKTDTTKKNKLDTIYGHLMALFNFSNMNDVQKNIMRNMSFLGITRVKTKVFKKWCNLSNMNEINELIESGWIQIDKKTNMIYLHQIIADLSYEELKDSNKDKLYSFIEGIINEDVVNYFLLDIIQSKLKEDTKQRADICSMLLEDKYEIDDKYIQYLDAVILEYSKYKDNKEAVTTLEKLYIEVTRRLVNNIAENNYDTCKDAKLLEKYSKGYLNILSIIYKDDKKTLAHEICSEIEYLWDYIFLVHSDYGFNMDNIKELFDLGPETKIHRGYYDKETNKHIERILDEYFETGFQVTMYDNDDSLSLYQLRADICMSEEIAYGDWNTYDKDTKKIEELKKSINEKKAEYEKSLREADIEAEYGSRGNIGNYRRAIGMYEELLKDNYNAELIEKIIDAFIQANCFYDLEMCEEALEYADKLIDCIKVNKSIAEIYSDYSVYNKIRIILKQKKERYKFEKYKKEMYELVEKEEYKSAEIIAGKALKYAKTVMDFMDICRDIILKYASFNSIDKQIEYISNFNEKYVSGFMLDDDTDMQSFLFNKQYIYEMIAGKYIEKGNIEKAFENLMNAYLIAEEYKEVGNKIKNTENLLLKLQDILKICEEYEYTEGIEKCRNKIDNLTIVQEGKIKKD